MDKGVKDIIPYLIHTQSSTTCFRWMHTTFTVAFPVAIMPLPLALLAYATNRAVCILDLDMQRASNSSRSSLGAALSNSSRNVCMCGIAS